LPKNLTKNNRYIRRMRNINLWSALEILLCGLFTVLSLGAATAALANPGDLDLSFGAGTGKVIDRVLAGNNEVAAAALDAQGRLVVIGFCSGQPPNGLGGTYNCVARYLSTGQRDESFGTLPGILLGSGSDCRGGLGLGLVATASGHILVGGSRDIRVGNVTTSHPCVMRLNSDGTVDPTFGTAGVATAVVPDGTLFRTASLTVLVSDKLLVAGTCSDITPPIVNGITNRDRSCFVQFSANGNTDSTFGSVGLLILDGPFRSGSVVGVTPLPSGFLSFGSCWDGLGDQTQLCVARVSAQGTLDATFGQSGVTSSPLLAVGLNYATGAVVLPDGGVMLAASCAFAPVRRGCLVRLGFEGSVDTSFGANGIKVDVSPWYGSVWRTLHRLASGDFVIAGTCGMTTASNYPCIWRVDGTGMPVPSFGTQGHVSVPFPPSSATNWRRLFLFPMGTSLTLVNGCRYPDASESVCMSRLQSYQNFFDLDHDGEAAAATDSILYTRHLLGFRDTALTSGALGTYADRTSADDIATYLSTPNPSYPNCSANIVGAPGGPLAMLDGIVFLRAMMGLTGDAVTNGIVFPAGTARTSWVDIKAHLNGNCGMALN
jgi:uncharacterized delta-60 repeat protein